MDFDSSDVAFLEGGEHVQHRVEAAPPETQKLKSFHEFSENKLNVLRQLEHTQRERTRMMNGQIRRINDVCISSERKTERAERMSEVYILLDVILTDENQEEWTPLHLPALFDELQRVLYTHAHTQTHTETALLEWF